jgi:hypothetical protein
LDRLAFNRQLFEHQPPVAVRQDGERVHGGQRRGGMASNLVALAEGDVATQNEAVNAATAVSNIFDISLSQ